MRYRQENKFNGSFLYIKGENEDDLEYTFETTGLISFAQAYKERGCTYEIIYALISKLSYEGKMLEEEGKDMDGWLLDPSYIYIEASSSNNSLNYLGKYNNDRNIAQSIKFIYYPGKSDNKMEVGLRYLAEFVIEHVEYKDKDAIDIAYGFYLQVTRGEYVFDSLLN